MKPIKPGKPENLNISQWLALASTTFIAGYYVHGDPILISAAIVSGAVAIGYSVPHFAAEYLAGVLQPSIQIPSRAREGLTVTAELVVRNRSIIPVIAEISLESQSMDVVWKSHVYLSPLSEKTIRIDLEAKFGRYCLEATVSRISDPLGMWSLDTARLASSRSCLVVAPKSDYSKRPMALGIAEALAGGSSRHRSSTSLEYRSFREYEQGDEPRLIEWKLSSRRGDLVVKELEHRTYGGEVPLLILAASRSSATEPIFESRYADAARIAVGIMEEVIRSGSHIKFVMKSEEGFIAIDVRGEQDILTAGYLMAEASLPHDIRWDELLSLAKGLSRASAPSVILATEAVEEVDIPNLHVIRV